MSDSGPGISAAELRDHARAAFRQFVWPVTIVTYDSPTGLSGMTVSSITSLSLDPPSVVLCINRDSRAFRHLSVGASIGVSLVSAEHRQLARRLSTRGIDKTMRQDETDRREQPDLPPGIRGAVAYVGAEVASLTDAHSHVVVIAQVREVRVGDGGIPPLAYYAGQFVEPALLLPVEIPSDRPLATSRDDPAIDSEAQAAVAVGVVADLAPTGRRRHR